jgi:chorismate mutase
VATSSELSSTTDQRTLALVRRIQEVEQEIARIQEERARAGETGDQARVEELLARVREAEEKLGAHQAVRRPVSESPAAVMKSVYRDTRITFLVLGGILIASGLVGVGAAMDPEADRMLVVVGAAPALVGILIFVKALFAKKLDDLVADDV